MIRSLSLICVAALGLSGCAGPIETRLKNHMVVALPDQPSFAFSESIDGENPTQQLAKKLIAAALVEKGFGSKDNPRLLVETALAERPADIAITTGETDQRNQVATAKSRELLQSCQDQEHRLTIGIFDVTDGTQVYSGSAAEYHCKGTLQQSLPHLVDGALAELGKRVTDQARIETHIRLGTD